MRNPNSSRMDKAVIAGPAPVLARSCHPGGARKTLTEALWVA